MRECYEYIDLVGLFLRAGVALYSVFREDGLARKWLTEPVVESPSVVGSKELRLTVHWDRASRSSRKGSEFAFAVDLAVEPGLVAQRHELVQEFDSQFPGHVSAPETPPRNHRLWFQEAMGEQVRRRESWLRRFEGVRYENGFHVAIHKRGDESRQYSMAMPSSEA